MKRRADGIKPQNSQRSLFSGQPARIILFDVTSLTENSAILKWCEALENVMSLACSLSGPSRIPFLGIICIRSYPEVLFPLQPLRGNYARLESALHEICAAANTCHQAVGSSVSSVIGEAIKEGLALYRRQVQGLLQTVSYWSQLELTLITGQEINRVIDAVKSVIVQLNLEGLKKIQVASTNTEVPFPPEQSPRALSEKSSDSYNTDGSGDSNAEILDYIMLENQTLSFETYLKGWLHEAVTDQEHIHIILPAADTQPQLTLKCDLQERVINPSSIPFPNCFILSLEGNHPKPASHISSRAAQQVFQICELKVVFRLPSKAVCESVLYGMPLVAKATSCWKIEWDELEANQEHFQALCNQLTEKDEVLLAQLTWNEPKQYHMYGNRKDVPNPRGMFLILPSHNNSLLIKPIATRELVLPPKLSGYDQATESSVAAIRKRLDKVELLDYYNPLLTSSNLHSSLIANLTRNITAAVTRSKPASEKPPLGRTGCTKSSGSAFTSARSLMKNKVQQPLLSKPESEFYSKLSAEFSLEL